MRSLTVVLAVIASATIQAQSPPLGRGQHVRVRVQDTARPAATDMVLIVVAVPQDRLSIARNTLYVNDMPVMQFSSDFLARIASAPDRIPTLIPQGHYFVMGERRSNGDISEYWGQHSGTSLQPAQ
jgi:Signal peptidase, peptidase S26